MYLLYHTVGIHVNSLLQTGLFLCYMNGTNADYESVMNVISYYYYDATLPVCELRLMRH